MDSDFERECEWEEWDPLPEDLRRLVGVTGLEEPEEVELLREAHLDSSDWQLVMGDETGDIS
jgi:hypothetical protein